MSQVCRLKNLRKFNRLISQLLQGAAVLSEENIEAARSLQRGENGQNYKSSLLRPKHMGHIWATYGQPICGPYAAHMWPIC